MSGFRSKTKSFCLKINYKVKVTLWRFLLVTSDISVWSSLVQCLQHQLSRIVFAWETVWKTSKTQVENLFFIFTIQTGGTFKQRCRNMWVWFLNIPKLQKSWLNSSVGRIIFVSYITWIWRMVSPKTNGNNNTDGNKTWKHKFRSWVLCGGSDPQTCAQWSPVHITARSQEWKLQFVLMLWAVGSREHNSSAALCGKKNKLLSRKCHWGCPG